jgi:hypothetical protein
MTMIESVLMMAVLMALGVAATWAVLIGLIYFFEVQDD